MRRSSLDGGGAREEEEAVDTGGPSREFWRLFTYAVMERYCIGDAGCCLFVRNTPAVEVR